MALESHLQKMFKKSGRITPAHAKFGVKKMSLLFANSMVKSYSNSAICRSGELLVSSNSFPRGLNKVGLSGSAGMQLNLNNPNNKLLTLQRPLTPN